MRFKLIESYESLDEVYFSSNNLERHYNRHVLSDEDGKWKMPFMTPEEYNNLANDLSNAKADKLNNRNADIIGYITKTGRSVKHQKSTLYTVVYVDDTEHGHAIISLYKQPNEKFFRKLNTANSPMAFGSHLQ